MNRAPLVFRAGPLGRYHALPVLLLAICNVVAFALLLVRGSRSTAGLIVASAITAAVLPVLWWWGLRVATLLHVEGDRLRWSAPLRTGSVPIDALVTALPARFGFGHLVLRTRSGSGVVVLGGRRVGPFLEGLAALAPDLDVAPDLLRVVAPGPRFRFDGDAGDAGR